MKLITHQLPDSTHACVCVSTYEERQVPASAGFVWNQIVPKAWATTSASVAAKLWMHADETTIRRLLKARVITQDQHDQRVAALTEAARFSNPRQSKRDRAEELAIRLAGRADLIEAIHFMLRFMAGRCDGAVKEDGVGFNGTDTTFGHELAARPSLSPKQAAWGQILLWKYMGQLGHLPQFDLVYGAEAEAERERMKEEEKKKLQQRMAGKKCKAHGAQITFLGKGKRVGFCDLCKPAEAQPEQQQPAAETPVVVNCANCQQPLAEDDDQLLCPACRTAQPKATSGLPSLARVKELAAAGSDLNQLDQQSLHEAAVAACGGHLPTWEARLDHVLRFISPVEEAERFIVRWWWQMPTHTPGCVMCAHPAGSLMRAGHPICGACSDETDHLTREEFLKDVEALKRLPRAPGAGQHPVDAVVALLTEAGLGDQIDPAKVEAARQITDQPVDASGVAVEARQSAPEASADAQAPVKPASGPVRAVAGLSCPLQPGTDRQWAEFGTHHAALRLMVKDEAQISPALDDALKVAGRLAKAEAKAGNIIKEAC